MVDINVPDQTISIVIPSYNDTPYLEACLSSLYSVEAGVSWKLIVVDDCSLPDHSSPLTKWAEELDFALLRLKRRLYFTRAINEGLKYAWNNHKPWWYFLLNSDTVLTPGWGKAILECHRKMNAYIIGCTLLLPDGRVHHAGAFAEGGHFGINDAWVNFREDRYVPWVTGAAMAIHRDLIQHQGLLTTDDGKPPGQYDSSDRRYCVTARLELGYEIAVAADAVIYHYTEASRNMRLREGHIR